MALTVPGMVTEGLLTFERITGTDVQLPLTVSQPGRSTRGELDRVSRGGQQVTRLLRDHNQSHACILNQREKTDGTKN
jgi:hypothetical protein